MDQGGCFFLRDGKQSIANRAVHVFIVAPFYIVGLANTKNSDHVISKQTNIINMGYLLEIK